VPSNCAKRHRQRLAGLEIEVIGRLVEQQQVGAVPHDQRQREPRFLAAGEVLDGAGRHVAREVEHAEKIAQFLLPGPRRDASEVPQRRFVEAQHLQLVLRKVADGEPLVEVGRAGERREFARDGLDQRGLSRAVDAEEPVALAAAQRKPDIAHDNLHLAVRWAVFHPVAGVHIFQREQGIGRLQRLAEFEGKGR
jgi:hypothetical protein